MATITFHDGLGTNGTVLTEIDWGHLTLNGFGNTATLSDPNGMQIVMQGIGMGYSWNGVASIVAAGTVNSLTVLDAGANPLFQVTGSDADAAWLYSWIVSGTDLNNDVNSGPGRLWGMDNTVYGAAQGEHILTGAGDDLIFGGGGADQISSSGGDDTVTGGLGADEFVEIRDGSLTVTDFHDVGPRARQDVLRMTLWEFRHMTTAQDGSDTVLTILERRGHGDSHLITLQDYDATRLDVRDFVFGF